MTPTLRGTSVGGSGIGLVQVSDEVKRPESQSDRIVTSTGSAPAANVGNKARVTS